MKEFMKRVELRVGNLQGWCNGEVTRRGKGKDGREWESAIDWMVFSNRVERRIVGMEIDEEGKWGVESDHAAVKVWLRAGKGRRRRERKKKKGTGGEGWGKVREKEGLEEWSRRVEQGPRSGNRYEDMIRQWEEALEGIGGGERKEGGKGGWRERDWWDEEVRAAVQERKI